VGERRIGRGRGEEKKSKRKMDRERETTVREGVGEMES
jgi:hypothetical protein